MDILRGSNLLVEYILDLLHLIEGIILMLEKKPILQKAF